MNNLTPIGHVSIMAWRAQMLTRPWRRDLLQWAVFEFGGPWPNETPLARLEAVAAKQEIAEFEMQENCAQLMHL